MPEGIKQCTASMCHLVLTLLSIPLLLSSSLASDGGDEGYLKLQEKENESEGLRLSERGSRKA